VDFSLSIGNEIRNEHPRWSFQTEHLNESSFGVLIVIPSSSSPPFRIHIDVPAGEAGLSKPSRIKCDQISKADIRRFRPNGRLGIVSPQTMAKVETVVRRLLEL
jgi:mRNA-degrading endonuclease toxin of MazEF toxin-antitoxin module